MPRNPTKLQIRNHAICARTCRVKNQRKCKKIKLDRKKIRRKGKKERGERKGGRLIERNRERKKDGLKLAFLLSTCPGA